MVLIDQWYLQGKIAESGSQRALLQQLVGEDIDARRERRRWARNEQDDQLKTQLVFIKEGLITSDD